MTGYATPGSGPQTGPATRNAPGGSEASVAVLPFDGSSTPMPPFEAYAISPTARAPATGVGVCDATGAELLPPHAAMRSAPNAGIQARRSLPVMESRSLTGITPDRFRPLL